LSKFRRIPALSGRPVVEMLIMAALLENLRQWRPNLKDEEGSWELD
jgi:hypothetical protein